MKIIIVSLMISSQIISTLVNGYTSIPSRSILSKFNILNLIFGPQEPETKMKTPQLIRHMGYPSEIHTLTTSDGYILEMHRIPNKSTTENKNPALLLHGIGGCSSDWIINLRNQSLGYILSDAGYDVWLGNFRGNEYAALHTRLSPDSKEFWSFSWNEMAAYDLPVMIDYVLNATGKSQLIFVGFSMGASAGFALLADKPKYNDKIQQFFAPAPIVFMNHIKDPLLVFAANNLKPIKWLADLFHIYKISVNSRVREFLVKYFCNSPLRGLCSKAIFQASGEEEKHFNATRVPIYLSQSPSSYSLNTIEHYGQLIKSKQWQHYDWGSSKKNEAKYGTKTPPKYDISNVKVPVALFRGSGDALATREDVKQLGISLKNLTGSYEIKDWNHQSYIWATNAGEALHKIILKLAENSQQPEI